MGFKLLGVSVVPERWGYEKRRPGKCNRSTPIAGGSVIPPSDRLIVVAALSEGERQGTREG